jgi:hypothetical protein
VKLVNNPIFENLIILTIALNSISLSAYDYYDRDNLTEYNQVIEKISIVFTIIFSVECLFKVIAMGFFKHRNAYLRDYWNWLDFIVVLVGFIELMPFMQISSLRSLRVLRVLRPLRSINAFPEMRIQINALLSSVPSLLNAVCFMLFIFILFGILGVQQFEGSMYQRCRLTEFPLDDGTWPYDESIPTLCRKPIQGETQCPVGTWCKHPLDGGLDKSVDSPIEQALIDFGLANFDNLAYAILTIFQMITMEGWTKIMYNLMDANVSWMAVIYCISLILITSFFILNVILAILAEAQDKGDEIEQNVKEQKLKLTNLSLRREARQRGKYIEKDRVGQLHKQLTHKLTDALDKDNENDDVKIDIQEEDLLTKIEEPRDWCCFMKRRAREDEQKV